MRGDGPQTVGAGGTLFGMTGLLALAALASPALLPATAPKLVLLISIDQFRADYVDRFTDHYLPPKTGDRLGGFRWLEQTGVRFTDAHHHHVPTATGPGHSVLMTGSIPAVNGIVGNEWFDRVAGKAHYVTSDDSVQTVGGTSLPQSPRPLKVTTVGDELKMATGGRSKVVGIAFKDRASILMAGHAADAVVWFDGGTGNWVTSTFYAPDKRLPAWAQAIDDAKGSQKALGARWTPSLPAEAYANARRAPFEKAPASGGLFDHPLGGTANAAYFKNLTTSAQGQEFLFDTVERAVDAEGLGTHKTPDVLVVNLSTNDYVGHAWGPNSPEVMDISVVTDRLLGRLFTKLNKTVPGGIDNVAIVVTADHGVAPIPEEAQGYRIESARVTTSVARAIDAALDAKYGPADWVMGDAVFEQNVYLNRAEIAERTLRPEQVEMVALDAALKVPGMFAGFTRTQLMDGRLPSWPWVEYAVNGFHPTLGGDLMVFEAPNAYLGAGTGTGHGSVWSYDHHVPILTRWRGQRPQTVARRVYTQDIASTLSLLLGIEYPSGNVGSPLVEALPDRLSKGR